MTKMVKTVSSDALPAELRADLPAQIAGLFSAGEAAAGLMPMLAEGVQLWDGLGNLLYASPASRRHFGDAVAAGPGLSYTTLVSRCLDEGGLPLLNHRFPVARVLENRAPATGLITQTRDADGQTLWVELNAYPIAPLALGGVAVVSTSHEISTLVEKSRQLERDAHHDPLTGLPNRALLSDRLNLALAHSQRRGEVLCVCMMDLDGFKPVNDTLGHQAGDRLLKEIARRLLRTLRSEDTVVRLGGDEFVLLLGGLRSEDECDGVLRRVLETVAQPFAIGDSEVRVTASLGVTLHPNDSAVADQLLRHADQAMYKAKEKGKNDYHLFDPTLESRHRANSGAKARIAKALAAGQFVLHYQPQVDCARGTVVGAEALLRWNHPVLGLRSPAEFLPLIENDDLIIELGNWVLDTALDQLAVWRENGLVLSLGVNISARHLLRGAFGERLAALRRRLAPELLAQLEIEILETAALEDMKAVSRIISVHRALGIGFALDDFGTGFSSLSHLKYLAVDTLKIDQTFVRDMLTDPGDLAIVQGVVGLSEAFRSGVVAEGVENIEQVLRLLAMGCAVMQGYGIARPMPAERLPGWIAEFDRNPLWNAAKDHYPSRQSFELLLLEVTQRNWLEQVRKAVQGAAARSRATAPLGLEDSRITRWYREESARVFGGLPAFHEIDALNREVHHIAADALAHARAGEAAQAEAAMQRLIRTNERLVGALTRLRNSETRQQ